jgi:DNA-binding MarR family transcriptional regulator
MGAAQVGSGSKCEELSVSESGPLWPGEQTSMGCAVTSLMGHFRTPAKAITPRRRRFGTISRSGRSDLEGDGKEPPTEGLLGGGGALANCHCAAIRSKLAALWVREASPMRSGDEKPALVVDLGAATGVSVFVFARLLAKAVTAIYDDKLRSFGITSGQFNLLAEINRGPITRAEITRHQHLSRSTLTRDLKLVFSAGWIEEVRVTANGRTKPICLTIAGKELMFDAEPAWRAAQAQAKALLGVNGMDTLMSITDRINRTS